MIFVPFIYFSLLLVYIIRKHGFDVSASMVTLYVATSLGSILLQVFDYEPYSEIKINFIPTFFYCALITLTIVPFYKFNSTRIKKIIKIKNLKLFNFIVYFYFSIFLVLLFISYEDLIFRFNNGSFVDLRNAAVSGNLESTFTQLSGVLKYLANLVSVFSSGSYMMILFFFYSICFLNNSKFFNIIILVSSLSVILVGMLGIDRSTTFYWILLFYLNIVLFKHFIGKAQRKIITYVIILLGSLLVAYFIIISISRFGEAHGGTQGGILTYAGQPFINFCNFWDNYTPPKTTFHRVFPLTYYVLDATPIDWDRFVIFKTGSYISVFFSSVGLLIVDAGIGYAIAFWILFYIFVTLQLRRKFVIYISFNKLIIFYLFAIIPQVGAIAYFYSNFTRTLFLILFLIISFYFRPQKVHFVRNTLRQ